MSYICAALLESAQSTQPKLAIKVRIAEARIRDTEPLTKAGFKAVVGLLNSLHGKQDFDAKLAQTQKTITLVGKFFPEDKINDFIRSQEESEVVTEFRRANPEKEVELVKLNRQHTENGRVVVTSTYPTWSNHAVLNRERLFVFKDGKAPESVMKQRTKARDSNETQDEDVEDVEDEQEEATIKNYTAGELNMDDIEFIAQNETEAAEKADGNRIDFLSEFPQFAQLEEVFKKSNGSCRLCMVNPVIFRAAGGTLNWETNAGHLVVRPIFKTLQVRRTMRTPLQLADGKVSYPAQDLLPSMIVLEEVSHDETKEVADAVRSMGQIQAQKLFNQKKESKIEDMHRSGNSQAINGQVKDPSPKLNFGEHRKGVLTSFDWHAVNKRVKDLGDPNTVRTNSQMERENKKQAAKSPPAVGVDKVEELLRNDINRGLSFFFHQTNSDPSFLPPGDRSSYIHWLCYMGTGVNMHTCCCRGVFMNWLTNAKGMLQIIYRLVRINHLKTVKFHLLKLKNSYYDNIERICVAKWVISCLQK
ncbi:hypothetical protein H9Q74_002952 [Fusarium xylarioides]|nr:hypothetical protein H9Q71_002887 [Fusarium xylarioides]KAG5826993.1 hypothetical protein H9Q74_002952 [Fusarium xylarioides]